MSGTLWLWLLGHVQEPDAGTTGEQDARYLSVCLCPVPPADVCDVVKLTKDCLKTEYVCQTGESELGLVLITKGFVSWNDVRTELQDLQEKIREQFGYAVTMGIGSRVTQSCEVSDSFFRARKAAAYSFIYGSGQIILYEAVAKRDSEAPVFPEKEMKAVLSACLKGDAGNVEKHLSVYVASCYTKSLSYGQAAVTDLLMELHRALPESAQTGNAFVETFQKLKVCRYMHEQFMVLNTYCLARMQGQSAESGRHREMTERMLKYIRENLSNPDLSISMVADHLQISTNSVRNLFRENNLPSPKDYITSERIAEAQELLVHTDMTGKEIGESTGFPESRYFYAVFKKATGMTTYEYRVRNR